MSEMIRMSSVGKQYRFGVIGGGTFQEELAAKWAKFRGKDNPLEKIGNIRHTGEKFWALRDISFSIEKGERVGIIGANGAGKSTLLKLLSRITAPTEGDIDLYGRVLSVLEIGTGFHGEMTGRENIYMNGSILGMKKQEIDEKIDDIIAFSEIEDFIDTPVKRYSSGMFVKLAFSVAAHLNSEIMIMDEVLAVGDMAFQRKCLDKMRQSASEEGKTVLYVSHNMETIRRLCSRVIVLSEGKIIFDGETEEGIAVYMEHSLGENETDMDLSAKERHIKNDRIRMKRLVLLDKVNPCYEKGENLRFKLYAESKEELSAMLRLTLRTSSDAGLGTAWSSEKTYIEGINEMEFEMPLEYIEKGAFYGSIGIYTKDELGYMIAEDHITRAFKIEVLGTPSWNTSAFGNIRFEFKENE